VVLRAGKYFLNETLALGPAHSETRWTAYSGETATISGGRSLASLDWRPYKGDILMAKVDGIPDLLSPAEQAHNQRGRQDPPVKGFGLPPARWNTMFVDGVRQVRARYPNGNPQDLSGICFSATNRPGEGCDGWAATDGGETRMMPNPRATAHVVVGPNRGESPTLGCDECSKNFGTFAYSIFDPPAGHPVYNKPMPGVGWENNSLFSFWGSPFGRPVGFPSKGLKKYANPAGAVVHMFHGDLWGGWQYSVTSQDDDGYIEFGYGGFQEARGSGINRGQHYYIENVLEELDEPGEWFFDANASILYFAPNVTGGSAAASKLELVAPLLDTLVSVKGAKDISFEGIDFTETRATYFEQYEVPSGGDWSIHRGGALFVEDSSNITISSCIFNQTGGNAVMLSNNVVDSRVTGNEFDHTGDSAIAVRQLRHHFSPFPHAGFNLHTTLHAVYCDLLDAHALSCADWCLQSDVMPNFTSEGPARPTTPTGTTPGGPPDSPPSS